MQEIQVAQTFDNLCFEPFCIVSADFGQLMCGRIQFLLRFL